MTTKRHAITATALANCLGNDNATVFDGAFAGREAFVAGSAYCELPFSTVLGISPELTTEQGLVPTRLAAVTSASIRQLRPSVQAAVERWGGDRIAYVFASSTGGLEASERALAPLPGPTPEYNYSNHWIDGSSTAVARYLGVTGVRMAISTACSSSFKALASAIRILDQGLADAVVVGSADTLCRTTIYGFHSLGLLSSTPTRPFSSERCGLTLGEGSAYLLVERDANDRAVAWIAGMGEASDAHHHTSPHPDGIGAMRCMRQALEQAGIRPDQIDYVSAHGTATPANDTVEAAAVKRVFERRVPITATKSLTGHTLGSAGLTALILAIESLKRQQITPSLRATPLDDTLDVTVIGEATRARIEHVLVNAFGFGGSNASVIISGAA